MPWKQRAGGTIATVSLGEDQDLPLSDSLHGPTIFPIVLSHMSWFRGDTGSPDSHKNSLKKSPQKER